jgi:hypothetical protein
MAGQFTIFPQSGNLIKGVEKRGKSAMAAGALIGAYQQDETGSLRALLPLSGRTLLEYQARCAAAAGAVPIVIIVEEIPAALNQALDRLAKERIPVIAVLDAGDAANRFGAGEMALLIGDGIVPPPDLLARVTEQQEPVIVTVPDDSDHQEFERIDAESRWAGIALVNAQALGATAAMLGEWDLQSTLLRRMLQSGARLEPIEPGSAEPILADSVEHLSAVDRQLIASSRGNRNDWASRFLLPLVEEAATESLSKTTIAPMRLVEAALLLTAAAAIAFFEGWRWLGLGLLIASTPLDLIGGRLAALRLQPLSARSRTASLLWPAAGAALVALGLWQSSHGGGWGAAFAAITCCAFAEADRIERRTLDFPGDHWLFSRRNAIFALLPFAAAGAWTAALCALALYAAVSFFVAQFATHSIRTG